LPPQHPLFPYTTLFRSQYPSASPSSAWFDSNSDTTHIIGYPNSTNAPPFISHPKYSVYIDDLRDASGNDVARVYDGPLYTTAGGDRKSTRLNSSHRTIS